jgi:hypothetical protein
MIGFITVVCAPGRVCSLSSKVNSVPKSRNPVPALLGGPLVRVGHPYRCRWQAAHAWRAPVVYILRIVRVHRQPTRFRRLVNASCVYTQQQPTVRRRILSETLKVLRSYFGRIYGILPWPMRGRPRNGDMCTPIRKKLERFHFTNESLRNTISDESNDRYTFSCCALPIFKAP